MKTKLGLQLGLLSVFGFAIWQFGFRLASLESGESGSPVSAQENHLSLSAQVSARDEEQKPEKSVREPSQIKREVDPVMAQFQSLVSKNSLEKKSALLVKAFRSGDVGYRLASVATLFQFGIREGTQESSFLGEQLQYLERRPTETLEEIKQGFTKMGPEFNRERLFLINYASRLQVDSVTKMEFYSSELKRAAMDPEPLHQSYFCGVSALQGLIQTSNDPGTVETALRDALKNQTEPNARFFLLAAYAEKDPLRASKLKEEFAP